MPTYIRTTRTADDGSPLTRRIDRPALSEPVEFDADGRAVVPDDDASHLLNTRPDLDVDDSRCAVVLDSGQLCGRDRPCQYHDDEDDEDDESDE